MVGKGGLVPVVGRIVDRHKYGHPLFTVDVTGDELQELREGLRQAVSVRGLEGLRGDGIGLKGVAFFASTFFAIEATELSWRPLLAGLGVRASELADYPQLYEPLERTLSGLGREIIVRRGRRFFLGTLLREGGLPTRLGAIARLVASHVKLRGWGAVLDEGVRDWMVDAIAAAAGGATGTLLGSEESRLALGELLGDVARTYDDLRKGGVDPAQLLTAEAVEEALAQHMIPVPVMRSRDLLVELLGTFREGSNRTRRDAAPQATLLAVEHEGMVAFQLAADLGLLDALCELPSTVALSATPGLPRAVVVRRIGAGFRTVADDESRVVFRLPILPATIVVTARWSLASGAASVAEVATLTIPLDEALWFGEGATLVSGALETIPTGATVFCVARSPLDLTAVGHVTVREHGAPVGFTRAFAIEVSGKGELHVTAPGVASLSISCGHARFSVDVRPGLSPTWSSASHVVPRLPSFVLPEGVEADMRISCGDRVAVVARAQRGHVVPNSFGEVASLSGRIRVAFETKGGERWSRTWTVLPRTFGVETRGCSVFVRHDSDVTVTSMWRCESIPRGARFDAPTEEEHERCELLLRHAGEPASLVVPVPRGLLRLRREPSALTTELLGEGTTIIEREVNQGACIEVAGGEGTRLVVRVGSETIFETRQVSSRKMLVPLFDVLARGSRQESPLRLGISVEDGATNITGSLAIEVPRYAKPTWQPMEVEPRTLRLSVTVDRMDLPVEPAVAFFTAGDPFAAPRIVQGALETGEDGNAVIKVPDPDAALSHGQPIVFLADRASTPPRPMSGGTMLRRGTAVAEPKAAAPLQVALLQGDLKKISDALRAEALGSAADHFFARLIEGSSRSAAYGLAWFYVYRVLSTESIFILLAATARLPRRERLPWLQMWKDQFDELHWTLFSAADARALEATLPERVRNDSADKMHLLGVAKDVAAMSRATELVICEALFRGRSLAPVKAGLRHGVPESVILPRDWHTVALPNAQLGIRWLKGTVLDGDDLKLVDETLARQLLDGERIRALREVFLLKRPPALPSAPTLRAGWFVGFDAALRNDWSRLASEGERAAAVCRIELTTLAFASAAHTHVTGRQSLPKSIRSAVRGVEALVPRLFEFWFSALQFFPPKDSP